MSLEHSAELEPLTTARDRSVVAIEAYDSEYYDRQYGRLVAKSLLYGLLKWPLDLSETEPQLHFNFWIAKTNPSLAGGPYGIYGYDYHTRIGVNAVSLTKPLNIIGTLGRTHHEEVKVEGAPTHPDDAPPPIYEDRRNLEIFVGKSAAAVIGESQYESLAANRWTAWGFMGHHAQELFPVERYEDMYEIILKQEAVRRIEGRKAGDG